MKQRGFTLVELAIVVTILGLLIVGVFKGQSLIGRAQSKDVIAIIEDLRSATTYFKQRYSYLPGDWPYTANEIQGVTVGASGTNTGNGYIDGSIDAAGMAEAGSEVAELPWQLYSAGFIGKINGGAPQQRITTSFGAVHIASKQTTDGLIAGFSAVPNTLNAIIFFNLPCEIAKEVDAKIDDGVLTTGRARALNDCTAGNVPRFAVAL